jgi:hypothetical protein
MIDRIFFVAMTFGLLFGGTLAIGSEWFEKTTVVARHHSVEVHAPAQTPVRVALAESA